MRKAYRCSNIKFCMENENQRRTWEYLQRMTRKDGSYGKILSDAFIAALDRKNGEEAGKTEELSTFQLKEQEFKRLEELLERVLETRLQSLQEILTGQIEKYFQDYTLSLPAGTAKALERVGSDGAEHTQEAELSEDMMAFVFAMGE